MPDNAARALISFMTFVEMLKDVTFFLDVFMKVIVLYISITVK